MHRHDVGSGPQVGVTDEGVQLTARFDKTVMDLLEPFGLFRGVTGPGGAQDRLL